MKIIDRIVAFIKHKKLSMRAFETSIGLSNGYISKQYKSSASVGGDIIEKIIMEHTDLNPLWLITGKGSMLINKAIVMEPGNAYITSFDELLEYRIARIVETQLLGVHQKLDARPTLEEIRAEIATALSGEQKT